MPEYKATAVAIFNAPGAVPALVSLGVGKAGDKILSLQKMSGDNAPIGYFGEFLPSNGLLAITANGNLNGQYLILLGSPVEA